MRSRSNLQKAPSVKIFTGEEEEHFFSSLKPLAIPGVDAFYDSKRVYLLPLGPEGKQSSQDVTLPKTPFLKALEARVYPIVPAVGSFALVGGWDLVNNYISDPGLLAVGGLFVLGGFFTGVFKTVERTLLFREPVTMKRIPQELQGMVIVDTGEGSALQAFLSLQDLAPLASEEQVTHALDEIFLAVKSGNLTHLNNVTLLLREATLNLRRAQERASLEGLRQALQGEPGPRAPQEESPRPGGKFPSEFPKPMALIQDFVPSGEPLAPASSAKELSQENPFQGSRRELPTGLTGALRKSRETLEALRKFSEEEGLQEERRTSPRAWHELPHEDKEALRSLRKRPNPQGRGNPYE